MKGRTSELSLRVRWGETDAAGIVFYPAFFGWFDMATHELLRDSGALGEVGREGGLSFSVVESGARFRAPAAFDEELVVSSTVTEIRRRSYRVEHVVARGQDVLATGYEVRVVAHRDASAGRLRTVEIPEDLRAYLAGDAGEGGPGSG